MSDLKKCPFCGNDAEIIRMGTSRVSMQIGCEFCGTSVETGETWIDENSTWNTRPAEEALQREVEELREVLSSMVDLTEVFITSEDLAHSEVFSVINPAKQLLERK